MSKSSERVERWASLARPRLKNSGLEAGELVGLHQSYSTRFAADNATIWVTAAIFVPLSLSAPPAWLLIPHRSLFVLFTLAVASLGLMAAWLVVAERHKYYQDRSLAYLQAIECRLNIGGVFEAMSEPPRRVLGISVRAATVRRSLPVVLISEWILVGIAAGTK